jgi:hydroxypyruvate isomerase
VAYASRLTRNQVEGLAQTLSFQATELEAQATTAIDNLRQAADNVFRSDDKLLSSLKKLGQELDPEDPEEKANVEKLRETCMR